ncbi:C1 family peptidase [Candidatus Uabimicrobium amorphum]|uniref:Cysteine protease n=1 Tax=Uabimicrobium amorphum TaxID=2596890 RepID=A0A5S9IP55_UABAM|nr:C1 family peptidase [Candidatus Uabimicrobium amorphum]BBM85523.1 cysteine protease [Candidatus Uabimicrobium amorphum]
MKKILSIFIIFMVTFPTLQADKSFYRNREQKANKKIKQNLIFLRQNIARKKMKFSVGYTTAMDFKISQLATLRLPGDLSQKMQKQNSKAKQLLAIDNQAFERYKKINPKKWALIRKKYIFRCFSNARSWDWRKRSKVTSVRNQSACGSCWAFATLGSFEGNFALRNGFQLDFSEQALLSCSGAGTCRGGWWAFDYLVSRGVPVESKYPYTSRDDPCNLPAGTRYYKAVTWGYVGSSSSVPNVAALKNALCQYGPLSVAVRVTPGFQAYTGGVFNESDTGRVNHGVTLIGWDDNKQAWLIKNSWGTGWGSTGGYGTERGYMWISYGSNKIGYAAAWVKAQRLFYKLPHKYYKLIKKFYIIPRDKIKPIKPIRPIHKKD